MNQDDKLILDTLNELIEEAKTEDGSFTLTKAELAELLFAQVGLNKREAKEMVEAFFEEIRIGPECSRCGRGAGYDHDTRRPGRR